jgi:hypothetical protein
VIAVSLSAVPGGVGGLVIVSDDKTCSGAYRISPVARKPLRILPSVRVIG